MRKDPQRLQALRQCLILESSAERVYDDLARLLATGLDVPLAMVSLLDEQRDWFKAVVGTALTESPASTSFCEAFFNSDADLIVVEDTECDERFAGHPMVAGPPHVRFYAAARLALDGQTLGTLCAYDLRPRQINAAQLQSVRDLAQAALHLLRQRRPALG
jgi:GAF domain-containing protein